MPVGLHHRLQIDPHILVVVTGTFLGRMRAGLHRSLGQRGASRNGSQDSWPSHLSPALFGRMRLKVHDRLGGIATYQLGQPSGHRALCAASKTFQPSCRPSFSRRMRLAVHNYLRVRIPRRYVIRSAVLLVLPATQTRLYMAVKARACRL